MKKIFILLLFVAATFKSIAQVSSLNETFNVYCVANGENYPLDWSAYNTTSFDPIITWTCGPDQGRPNTTGGTPTPGIMCTNLDGATTYLDTAWLFTPTLNLSFYTGNIYLQFDSKYVLADGRLSVLVSNDYNGGNPDTLSDTHPWYDATSSLNPVLGNVGTSDWVTYVVDLTAFKSTPLVVAFRYTAGTSEQSTWIIDNVNTTQTPPNNGVSSINKQSLFLNVIGNSSREQVSLSYNVPYAATYLLTMYDMIGRIVYKESVNAQPGTTAHTLSDLNLTEGMYLVKMENGTAYNTAKIMIN